MSSCDAPVVLIEGCSICKFISIGFGLFLPLKVILGFVKQPMVYDLFSFFYLSPFPLLGGLCGLYFLFSLKLCCLMFKLSNMLANHIKSLYRKSSQR